MTAAATLKRNAKIRSLTELVAYFDMSNPVHLAHYQALSAEFGELAAIMLIGQDAARAKAVYSETDLELTDPGEIASWFGWTQRNRVVRHGQNEHARYWIIDPDSKTKVGGEIIPMFTRDQTVPAYTQPE